MRLDSVLITMVVGMAFFVYLGYPSLALLLGLLGVLYIGMNGDQYASFKEVEVPAAGDYPKFEFWKGLVEDSAKFLGGQTKKFTRIGEGVDAWSGFMKKKVFGGGGSAIYMLGPMAMNLPDDALTNMARLGVDKAAAEALVQLYNTKMRLLETYANTRSRKVKSEIKKEIEDIDKMMKRILEESQKKKD